MNTARARRVSRRGRGRFGRRASRRGATARVDDAFWVREVSVVPSVWTDIAGVDGMPRWTATTYPARRVYGQGRWRRRLPGTQAVHRRRACGGPARSGRGTGPPGHRSRSRSHAGRRRPGRRGRLRRRESVDRHWRATGPFRWQGAGAGCGEVVRGGDRHTDWVVEATRTAVCRPPSPPSPVTSGSPPTPRPLDDSAPRFTGGRSPSVGSAPSVGFCAETARLNTHTRTFPHSPTGGRARVIHSRRALRMRELPYADIAGDGPIRPS